MPVRANDLTLRTVSSPHQAWHTSCNGTGEAPAPLPMPYLQAGMAIMPA
jgi:hypothetical protein